MVWREIRGSDNGTYSSLIPRVWLSAYHWLQMQSRNPGMNAVKFGAHCFQNIFSIFDCLQSNHTYLRGVMQIHS